MSMEQLRGGAGAERAELEGLREECVGRRLEVERLGGGVAGDDPAWAIERPKLVTQAPEQAMGDGRCDPIDHQAQRSFELGQPLTEEVDELHQDCRLGRLAERAVGLRQRPQVFHPTATRASRVDQALHPCHQHPQQLSGIARDFARNEDRVTRLVLPRELPGGVVE
ncbi:MAG: hypothetical protein JOY56_00715 [Solirubrobacterales bacterium]|nr:hypothetical protein [Solirubrobacterales bacterium]